MALYKNSVKQTLLNLIKAENPKFATATLDNVSFGPPVGSATTTVKVRGIPSKGFTGVATVQYQRVHIQVLFTGTTGINIRQYNASRLSDLLPRINSLYGLNLTKEDLSTDPLLSGASASVALNVAISYQYYSSIIVTWTKGSAPQLWEIYPNTTLTSLTVPDLMLKAFQVDYSASKSVIEAVATGTPLTTSVTGAQALINLIATSTGKAVTLGSTATPGTGDYDLSGFTVTRVTQSQLSDSNPSYRQIAVLTPPSVYGKRYSTIYLHYDKTTTTPTYDVIQNTELDGLVLPS